MASNYLAKGLKRSALTVALGLCFVGGVQAQSTQGSIYGTIPGGEGATVVVSNNSGMSRTVSVDAEGDYQIGSLPVGQYTVTATRGGQVVGTRTITVRAGTGSDVSFGGSTGGATTLGTVTVTADSVPPIDITSVDSSSVLTAQQLERLPVAHDAEAIALLAPGAVAGAGGYFGGLVSFGGAGVSENAYYVNGYFTGEPLSNLGGFTLPYGAIEQQETYIGGYSAKYGRSAGGVISQIGKRGTNEWHFGGQVTYVPESLRNDQVDVYLPDLDLPEGYTYTDPDIAGQLYTRGSRGSNTNTTLSAYAGGPILKDRLFFFAAAEGYKSESESFPSSLGSPRSSHSEVTDPKLYAKIDWNITNNHFLELTYMGEKYEAEGNYFDYDFDADEEGAQLDIVPTPVHQNSEYFIGKYTGYLTDNLTFSATYGRSRFNNIQINPGILPGVPYIVSYTNQDPDIVGTSPIPNRQSAYQGKDARDYTEGLRADLEYIWGDHTFTVGIDNIKFEALNEGTSQVAQYWGYGRSGSPDDPLVESLGVGPVGGDGYYVRELRYFTSTSMSLEQKAWYLQDQWQVTDNFLVSLGIRNDQFTNANNNGDVYMDAKNQWAPRLGFSWDVMGDSSLKVFGNAGRYFLALPNNVAIRGASASTFTYEYYTYTGVDANGGPTGLTPVPGVDGAPPPGPVSSNGETGSPPDVLAFAPSDLKNLYQDEYILGFEKQLTPDWMLGMKLTHRSLKSSVDDICDPYTLMEANGLTPFGFRDGKFVAEGDIGMVEIAYCYMFNPGGTNTFSLADVDENGVVTGGRTEVVMSAEDWGFTDGLKRDYNGLDIYLERPFDGKWEARIDYTFSKLKGNNEGQVKSEFGQDNISKTQDWDAWQIMQYGSGYLANDRRHQLKARGSYQITDEWSVGGNLRIMSGMPISCLGFFNPDGSIDETSSAADPIAYGSSYHTCFGEIASPGAVRTPWTRKVDLGVTYRPLWADQKLALGVQVFNVTNERGVQQVNVTSEDDPYTVSNTFMLPISIQTPRYVMFTASYDW
jgi:outer membrane receptor protein involved in Fe transport